jgi:hypothetical protein
LSMRCREKPVRIQKNDLVSSKFEGYAPSCLKIGARPKKTAGDEARTRDVLLGKEVLYH